MAMVLKNSHPLCEVEIVRVLNGRHVPAPADGSAEGPVDHDGVFVELTGPIVLGTMGETSTSTFAIEALSGRHTIRAHRVDHVPGNYERIIVTAQVTGR